MAKRPKQKRDRLYVVMEEAVRRLKRSPSIGMLAYYSTPTAKEQFAVVVAVDEQAARVRRWVKR